ncbi:YbjQ family protein [Massilia sp. Dwa41.01b]|uniref:YbjQ family protein n=1 Tax=unclassified Massilia TaxID=2609279 RepID=UPI001604197A|nr:MULTISPECIES: heavy metal-binding domain-containing protein [unclassified Massilia]QNA87490.1 YbjQ family protein [Massilia sp. Dwa41.01b]QNA98395.1 YbjQ family protein [Massilia sp. Se16.2.3]
MELIFLLVFWVVPLVLGYVFGQMNEKRHYRSIYAREKTWLALPTTASRVPLSPGQPVRCELVSGSVVVSVDYFKRAAAALRKVVGGPVKSYESLLDRAKREAVLRLKESCPGAHEIVNLRLETASLSKNMQGAIGSVEVFAFATALYFAEQPARHAA